MNKRFMSVLAFAVIVSAVSSFILYKLITAQMAASAKSAGSKVLVAARNLESGALIKDGDVKLADWGGPVPQNALVKPEDAVGRGVIEPIYSGEPILESRVAARGAGAGLAAIIPAGMRAVAVRVNDVVGVAGFVSPGMHVDVLVAGNPPNAPPGVGTLTKTLLQNIEVLSAGQNIQKDAEGKPVSVAVVNMLVTPEQAEILSLASNETRIQLVLRNPMDKEVTTPSGTAISYLFSGNKPGPAIAEKPRPAPPFKQAARKVTAPPAPIVQPPPPPIMVEVIHGSRKSEMKFENEDKQKQDKVQKIPEAKP